MDTENQTHESAVPVYDLLPSQWFDRAGSSPDDIPERKLLVAVLFDAIRLLHFGGAKQRAEVTAWIQGSYTARLPFRDLCDGLQLEPRELARRIARMSVGTVLRRRTRVVRGPGKRSGPIRSVAAGSLRGRAAADGPTQSGIASRSPDREHPIAGDLRPASVPVATLGTANPVGDTEDRREPALSL